MATIHTLSPRTGASTVAQQNDSYETKSLLDRRTSCKKKFSSSISSSEQKIDNIRQPEVPSYMRRMEDRLAILEQKTQRVIQEEQGLREEEKKMEEARGGDECVQRTGEIIGNCVSSTVRAIIKPFVWLGRAIAKATGCSR